MKKYLIILLVIIMVITTGCGSRTALTIEEFNEQMREKGLTIVDATDQFEEGLVEGVSIAMAENYQIEFYIVSSDEQAVTAFEQNKTDFEAVQSGSSSDSSASAGNYSEYARTTDDAYYVVSRVDNTFIYLVVEKKYKDEVKELVEGLGY